MKIPRNAANVRVASRNEIFVVILITFVKLMNSLLSRIIKIFSSSMLRIHVARRISEARAHESRYGAEWSSWALLSGYTQRNAVRFARCRAK